MALIALGCLFGLRTVQAFPRARREDGRRPGSRCHARRGEIVIDHCARASRQLAIGLGPPPRPMAPASWLAPPFEV
jgi:hypothetical protein